MLSCNVIASVTEQSPNAGFPEAYVIRHSDPLMLWQFLTVIAAWRITPPLPEIFIDISADAIVMHHAFVPSTSNAQESSVKDREDTQNTAGCLSGSLWSS